MSRRAVARVTLVSASAWCLSASLIAVTAAPRPQAAAAAPTAQAAPLTDAAIEQFLLKAEVRRTRAAGKGITGSLRATMTDGTITHDAHIQTIDESKREFRSDKGTEFNFRDSWGFNVAAYKIDRLLGLNMVPVSVERRWRTTLAAYSWWLDDVLMDEGDRIKKKVSPPDLERWNQQMQLVRLFDQLIGNIDRNLGNLVITNDWTIWAIDHTRAFRTQSTLKTPGNIARCDRQVFARLKQLDKKSIQKAVDDHISGYEIDALLKRRDLIVKMIEERGDAGLFDRGK
jgi:hypothetical protein